MHFLRKSTCLHNRCIYWELMLRSRRPAQVKHSGGFSIIAEEMRRIASKVKETSANIYAVLESSGTLAGNTVEAIQAAGETLELLEVSANLSIELSRSISETAKIRYDDLKLYLPAAVSENSGDM